MKKSTLLILMNIFFLNLFSNNGNILDTLTYKFGKETSIFYININNRSIVKIKYYSILNEFDSCKCDGFLIGQLYKDSLLLNIKLDKKPSGLVIDDFPGILVKSSYYKTELYIDFYDIDFYLQSNLFKMLFYLEKLKSECTKEYRLKVTSKKRKF